MLTNAIKHEENPENNQEHPRNAQLQSRTELKNRGKPGVDLFRCFSLALSKTVPAIKNESCEADHPCEQADRNRNAFQLVVAKSFSAAFNEKQDGARY